MNTLGKHFIFLLMCFAMVSCESEYSQTVKRELQSGKVYEDLILGLKMGQTQKEFYDHCWQLNKKKVISQGSGNRFARKYILLDSTENNAPLVDMLFYGIFDEAKVMNGMHMKMSYLKWSPWAKDYHSDVLLKKLQEKYLKQYSGNPFIEITIDEDINAYTKIDGNRQILIYPTSDKDVTVKIQDLRKKFGVD